MFPTKQGGNIPPPFREPRQKTSQQISHTKSTNQPNPPYLHVVEHSLDDLLAPCQLPLYLVAVCLGVLWMEVVYPLRFVLDPALDVVKLRVGGLGIGVDLGKKQNK